ncbi:MAG: MarR family winged helix-turn-helix transcriptional regulator [Firmicutes bacterium]|nr:MarR family winged helix-turn-helix transcriptional regulator [Bacillota bacterium]
MDDKEQINKFFVDCFYSILSAEERALEPLCHGNLSVKEIHVIEAVYLTKKTGENNFSSIAKRLGVALGTLTASFSRLEQKGLLYKVRDDDDKRVFYIELTPFGEEINDAHTRFHEQMVDGIVTRLSQEELNHLVFALDRLGDFFKTLGTDGG